MSASHGTAVHPTVEAWAMAYLAADDWATKLAPPPIPDTFDAAFCPRRDLRPGRGSGFLIAEHGVKSTGKSKLNSGARRAGLMHTFLHHELQAAELFAWALCAFPGAPQPLRRGLVGILGDELRHMNLYRGWLERSGVAVGSLPVRDWFWERIPTVERVDQFLATMGLGFEGANLDHAARFAERFERAGDREGAEIQRHVGAEEIPHVRFALTWFRELSPLVRAGVPLFEAFVESLPEPLSPVVMKGPTLAHEPRRRAGLPPEFIAALEAIPPIRAQVEDRSR